MQRVERTDAAEGREVRAGAKRRRILAAARDVFSERGFDAARMDEVARRARVSKGTLYNFFASKEDLFVQAVAATLEDSRLRVRASADPHRDAPDAALEAVLRSLLLEVLPEAAGRSHRLHDQAWGLIVRGSNAGRRVETHLRAFYRERESEFEENFTRGASAGVFRDDLDPAELGEILLAVFDGLVRRAALDRQRVDPKRTLETLLRLLDGGVRARRGGGAT